MNNCIIHKGELNLDTLLPIDTDGNHILYGYRLCNVRECVNPEHITTNIKQARNKGLRPAPLFHKRNDITGEELAKLATPVEPGTRNPQTCTVPDCIKPARALTLCNGHHLKYTKWRKANNITAKRISLDKTDVLQAALPPIGANHFKPRDRYCHIQGCEGKYQARGLCKKHHNRFLRAQKTA